MKAASLLALLERGANARRELFGQGAEGEPQLIQYENEELAGYFSPVTSQQVLTREGFEQEDRTTVRIAKTEAAAHGIIPEKGKEIIILGSNLHLRIDTVAGQGMNPEWVLGCKAI